MSLTTDGSGVSATTALDDVRRATAAAYPHALIKKQARSINLEIPGQAFGFDLIPAWYRYPNGYWIPDADANVWLATDPEAHADMMTQANEASNGTLKPLIKMMKHWSRQNLDALRSFHIELICKAVAATESLDTWSIGMTTMLLHMQSHVGQVMMDPIYGTSRVDKELSASALQGLKVRLTQDVGRAIEALRAENAGKHEEAIALWRIIFLSGF